MVGMLGLTSICGEALLAKCAPWGKQDAFMLNRNQSRVRCLAENGMLEGGSGVGSVGNVLVSDNFGIRLQG